MNASFSMHRRSAVVCLSQMIYLTLSSGGLRLGPRGAHLEVCVLMLTSLRKYLTNLDLVQGYLGVSVGATGVALDLGVMDALLGSRRVCGRTGRRPRPAAIACGVRSPHARARARARRHGSPRRTARQVAAARPGRARSSRRAPRSLGSPWRAGALARGAPGSRPHAHARTRRHVQRRRRAPRRGAACCSQVIAPYVYRHRRPEPWCPVATCVCAGDALTERYADVLSAVPKLSRSSKSMQASS